MSEDIIDIPRTSALDVALATESKYFEERILRHIELIKNSAQYDAEMAQIAFIRIQEGFMWLNRAVFQPPRVDLPEDKSMLDGRFRSDIELEKSIENGRSPDTEPAITIGPFF